MDFARSAVSVPNITCQLSRAAPRIPRSGAVRKAGKYLQKLIAGFVDSWPERAMKDRSRDGIASEPHSGT